MNLGLSRLAIAGLAAMFFLTGCAYRTGYGPYVQHMPKSILVLPPVNNSVNVQASNAFLSTISSPLAEAGYYVYPIAVIDRLFKDNGVPTPNDMHSVPLKKIDEIIGPDAVMYITINEWTTTYIFVDSTTSVTLSYRLVDTKTGLTLWARTQTVRKSSSEGQSNPIAMVIVAQIHAMAASASDGAMERNCAANANAIIFYDQHQGLLVGAHNPRYEEDQKQIRKEVEKDNAEAARERS